MIGGGISGLAAAHFLAAAGADVEIFEGSDRWGGLGTFFAHEGRNFERFYHVMLPTDDHLLSLLGELGIEDRVYWKSSSLGFLHRGRMYRLDSPLDLLRFRPVPFLDRVRLGLSALYAGHVAGPDGLDEITAEQWLTSLSGRRAFQRFWQPLLETKFGPAYGQIPALWYWARFKREKGTGKETKGYIRGGYKGIADRIVEHLASRGVELRLGTPVDCLDVGADGLPVIVAGGAARQFDRVISTVPLALLQKMTSEGSLAAVARGAGTGIDYLGVVNVLLMLRRPLTDHYWIPVVDCGVPFQGIIETTHTIDAADTGGRTLVYLMRYAHRTDPLFTRDPAELGREYVDALLRLMPGLSPGDIESSHVFRAPFVEPLYTVGYARRKPPATLVDGRVFLATTAQIYPEVTSWNSAVGSARRVVDGLVESAIRP